MVGKRRKREEREEFPSYLVPRCSHRLLAAHAHHNTPVPHLLGIPVSLRADLVGIVVHERPDFLRHLLGDGPKVSVRS
jgi:hypothetical protein